MSQILGEVLYANQNYAADFGDKGSIFARIYTDVLSDKAKLREYCGIESEIFAQKLDPKKNYNSTSRTCRPRYSPLAGLTR